MSDLHGYTANSPYIAAYFRQQHASSIPWTLLLASYQLNHEQWQDAPHLELGFGQGLGLAITAASTGYHQVGVDFMEAQVNSLQQQLDATDISKRVQLVAADFAHFLAHNQQQFASISLHGVWSWVSENVRHEIISIIERFLLPGGVVYLSYNVLPGRAPILPMQRLIHHTANAFSDHADQGLTAALAVLGSALPISNYTQDTPSVQEWWHDIQQQNPTYLRHEYLGAAWQPMNVADIAAKLSTSKLSFISSADVQEQLLDLQLSNEQQTWLSAIPDRALSESYQDLLRNQGFRRDLWGNSLQTINLYEQHRLLADAKIMLIQPVDSLPYHLVGDYQATDELMADLAKKAVHFLAQNHYQRKTVSTLWQHIMPNHPPTEQIYLLKLLTALGYIHPTQSSTEQAQHKTSAQSLNRYLCQQAWQGINSGYLASAHVGCGIQVADWQQKLLWLREVTQTNDPDTWIATWIQTSKNQALNIAKLTEVSHTFAQQRLPLLLAHECISSI